MKRNSAITILEGSNLLVTMHRNKIKHSKSLYLSASSLFEERSNKVAGKPEHRKLNEGGLFNLMSKLLLPGQCAISGFLLPCTVKRKSNRRYSYKSDRTTSRPTVFQYKENR